MWKYSAVVGLVIVCVSAPAVAANICDGAARRAAAETRVPVDVLLAITRLETGRGKNADPWPWAVNHAGDGTWFKSEDEARSFVFSRVKRGVSNIDIGCFQINYRWHAEGFRSLDDMFDPDLNARYAAEFLMQLYREFGDWTEAAGAYHSRTPEFAQRYIAKFRGLRARVADIGIPLEEAPTQKSFIRRAGKAKAGSVFLSDATGATPFIDFGRTN
jgi:hypothetical protein